MRRPEDEMLRSIAAAALFMTALMLAPAIAKEQVIEANDAGQISFTMPSGNVGCLYTPEGGTDVYEPAGGGPELICERVEPSYVTVILSVDGEAEMIEDPGEQSCCGDDNIFAYGNTLSLDGFTCASKTTGITCENESGEGFSMARAGVELFGPEPDDGSDDSDDADDTEQEDEGEDD
jgi:hypothetical protein